MAKLKIEERGGESEDLRGLGGQGALRLERRLTVAVNLILSYLSL